MIPANRKLPSKTSRVCLKDGARRAIPVSCQNQDLLFQMVNIQRHIYSDFYIPRGDIRFLPDSACAGNTHAFPISAPTAVKVFEHEASPSEAKDNWGADLDLHCQRVLLSRHAARGYTSSGQKATESCVREVTKPILNGGVEN